MLRVEISHAYMYIATQFTEANGYRAKKPMRNGFPTINEGPAVVPG